MAAKTWVLTDVAQQEYVDSFKVTAKDVTGAPEGLEISKRTLRGGLSEGVDVVRLNNGKLTVEVLPTRGMSLWKAWSGDDVIGWDSPVRGPVHPSLVDLGEPSGLGWLDGFDELLVRCGLESNGAPEFNEQGQLAYTLHGRIGNRPAERVTVSADPDKQTISVTGEVYETRFHFLKLKLVSTLTMRFNENGLQIDDQIHNLSASAAEGQLLYHANFGHPALLDAGAQLIAPLKTVVPRNDHAAAGIKQWNSYAAPEAGFEEQVYFIHLLGNDQNDTTVMLKNAHSTKAVSLDFNTGQLPCFTVWKNTTAREDGCVTGIEPGVNFPNPRSYEGEQGRVIKLDPGGHAQFRLGINWHSTDRDVQATEQRIEKLQSAAKPKIFQTPQPGWCADT
jgi:hypothetical protein